MKLRLLSLIILALTGPLSSLGMTSIPSNAFDHSVPLGLQCFNQASLSCFNNQVAFKYGTGQIDDFTYQASMLHLANLHGQNVHTVVSPVGFGAAPNYFDGSRFSLLNSGFSTRAPASTPVGFFDQFGSVSQ